MAAQTDGDTTLERRGWQVFAPEPAVLDWVAKCDDLKPIG